MISVQQTHIYLDCFIVIMLNIKKKISFFFLVVLKYVLLLRNWPKFNSLSSTRTRSVQKWIIATTAGLNMPSLHLPVLIELKSIYEALWVTKYFLPYNLLLFIDETLQKALITLFPCHILWQVYLHQLVAPNSKLCNWVPLP